MNYHYSDIRSRIPTDPLWWDEYAVPRYDPFTPESIGLIYAHETALIQIECQNCRREFKVCMSNVRYDPVSLRAEIEGRSIHYGDPPNVECCPSGPSMNSIPRRVLEYWTIQAHEWVRDPSLEVEIDVEEEETEACSP